MGFALQTVISAIILYAYLFIVEWGGDYFFFYVKKLNFRFK